MKKMLWVLLFLLLSGCAETGGGEYTVEVPYETDSAVMEAPSGLTAPVQPELLQVLINPLDTDFVRVTDYIPDVLVELKYAGTDNFTDQKIYEFEDVFLRYGTVMKLKSVAQELAAQGLRIKIWDGFRPVSAQFKLWEVCPDDTYVADPNLGFSNHSRGFAVDLTLADSSGRELEMPTAYDDFSGRADRDYSDCTENQASNARFLEEIMEKHGFLGYQGEWWHFNDTARYDVEHCFDPGIITRGKTTAQAPLLRSFREEESWILTIPAGEDVSLLGYDGEYALVEYWGYRGYVNRALLS